MVAAAMEISASPAGTSLRFNVLPKDTMADWNGVGFDLPTLWLLDNWLYLLSHSHISELCTLDFGHKLTSTARIRKESSGGGGGWVGKGSDLSVFLKMLLLPSRTVSWKARAAWWLSSTAVSLYRMASSLPALHRKELVRPGWSTSCTVAAIRAATSSSWSRLLWNGRELEEEEESE